MKNISRNRLIIFFLIVLAFAGLDQLQGDFRPRDFFVGWDEKMTISEYASWLVKIGSFVGLVWDFYLQERNGAYSREFLVAAVLMTGFIVDFIIEGTHSWISIGPYAFGYRAVVFLVFGAVIGKRILKDMN